MASLSQRVVDSLAKSQADYAARLAAGTQPLPPPALTRVLPFLDYTNTQALVAVNVAYLVRARTGGTEGALSPYLRGRARRRLSPVAAWRPPRARARAIGGSRVVHGAARSAPTCERGRRPPRHACAARHWRPLRVDAEQ